MKLDLILENIRNRYSLGLLEESEGMSEKDVLRGKIMINEATMSIRNMLVEEGTIAAVHQVLQEDWSDAVSDAYNNSVGAKPAVDALSNAYDVDPETEGYIDPKTGMLAAGGATAALLAAKAANARGIGQQTVKQLTAGPAQSFALGKSGVYSGGTGAVNDAAGAAGQAVHAVKVAPGQVAQAAGQAAGRQASNAKLGYELGAAGKAQKASNGSAMTRVGALAGRVRRFAQ